MLKGFFINSRTTLMRGDKFDIRSKAEKANCVEDYFNGKIISDEQVRAMHSIKDVASVTVIVKKNKLKVSL